MKFQLRLYSYISRKTSLKISCAVFSFALSRSFWLFIRVCIGQMSRMMVYIISTERKNILEQVTRDLSEPLLLLQKISHLKRQANSKKTISLTEKQRNVIQRCQEITKSLHPFRCFPKWQHLRKTTIVCIDSFALIVSAHPYCSRIHGQRHIRANGHWYNFAFPLKGKALGTRLRSWMFGDSYFSFDGSFSLPIFYEK